MILDIVKDRRGSSTAKDILQVILEGSENGGPGESSAHEFIVDNCKDILLAASEGTAFAAMWGLMLLASNPEWQARARSEVKQVCDGHLPNLDMLGKMKVVGIADWSIKKHRYITIHLTPISPLIRCS